MINLDMLCPPGLSGAPVIREDRRDVIGVIFEEQATTMYKRTVIFGRAHHLDVLRSACAAVTGGGHWLSFCRNRLTVARGADRSC